MNMTKRYNAVRRSALVGFAMTAILAAGCARQQPVAMAPPVSQMQQQGGGNMAPGGGYGGDPISGMQQGGGPPGGQQQSSQGAYSWQDVPVNQQVPITRAVFDQGGYQLYANTGDTIAIPFANQSMYVLKFGQSGAGGMYFVNDGTAPTLYVPTGGYLENASAQGAHWYPFSQGFNYTNPVYIGIAPTWNDYMSMGWYPGMMAYGGYWGYHPYGLGFSAMPGLYFNIGGSPYYGWNSYHSYYYAHPYNRVYVSSGPRYNYSSAGRRGTGSFGRSSFGSTSRSTGSFGRSSGSSFGRSTGSFGRSSNSFGTGSSSFGRSSGSFGRGSSGFGSSTQRSTGSFGGSQSGFGSGSRSSGGSFGGTRSFGGGSSFGGSRGFGGGSFGGRSSGGSFGGGRRR